MDTKSFLAFDLGATSGRSILGTLSDSGLETRELTRFPNNILKIGSHCFWNIYDLFGKIKEGLCAAGKENVKIESVGIDTWGVDFVCIGADGQVLGLPRSYRDPYTKGVPEAFFRNVMRREELYSMTGIQIMDFNSIFQLYAMLENDSSILKAADKILFLPDALSYMLTGKMVTEYTIASTSQLVDPLSGNISEKLTDILGLGRNMFARRVMPGHIIGNITRDIAVECGFDYEIPVIAVAGHDTASAVAAVPATKDSFAYLSSGTWSLMGVETHGPVINGYTYRNNITNEGGVDGTIRLLKNITGMWLLENCMKEWKKEGKTYSYEDIVIMAGNRPQFRFLIDPDDPSFANPDSMTSAIASYCSSTGQQTPAAPEDFVCCIFESLALRYKEVLGILQECRKEKIETLHIIGGGSRNRLLNRYAANATGTTVIAGPAEATAIGNLLIQAMAYGLCSNIDEMRALGNGSVSTETFHPEDFGLWEKGFEKYSHIKRTLNSIIS